MNTNTIDVASDTPVSQSLVQVNLLTGFNTVLGQLPSNGMAVTGTDLISALDFGTDGVLYALDALGNEFTISSNGIERNTPGILKCLSTFPWRRLSGAIRKAFILAHWQAPSRTSSVLICLSRRR